MTHICADVQGYQVFFIYFLKIKLKNDFTSSKSHILMEYGEILYFPVCNIKCTILQHSLKQKPKNYEKKKQLGLFSKKNKKEALNVCTAQIMINKNRAYSSKLEIASEIRVFQRGDNKFDPLSQFATSRCKLYHLAYLCTRSQHAN